MGFVLRMEDFAKDGFPLAALHAKRQSDYPPHSHDFQELVVTLSGEGVHRSGDESYRIEAGDVFVVGGREVHSYEATKELNLAMTLFDFSRLGLPLQDLRSLPGFLALFELEPKLRAAHRFKSRLRLAPRELHEAETKLFKLLAELQGRAPGYKALCCGVFLELVASLSRCSSAEPSTERKELWKLVELLRWMEASDSADASLDEMARRAGMSRRNFQRVFKAATGVSPIQKLLETRLAKAAKALIDEPGLNAGELALRYGFCDGNYFSKRFTKAYGLSPGQYRKRRLLGGGAFSA